jgi:hypothetical protein
MKISTAVIVSSLALLPWQNVSAATQVHCHAMFQKADTNGDGLIGGSELLPFLAGQIVQGLPINTAVQMTVNAQEFEEECMRNQFEDAALQQ